MTPNGPEMSRPASQSQYRAETKHVAGRVGSIELLGRFLCTRWWFLPSGKRDWWRHRKNESNCSQWEH